MVLVLVLSGAFISCAVLSGGESVEGRSGHSPKNELSSAIPKYAIHSGITGKSYVAVSYTISPDNRLVFFRDMSQREIVVGGVFVIEDILPESFRGSE